MEPNDQHSFLTRLKSSKIGMSLRIKVLFAAILAISIPLVGYLVLDSTINKSLLLQDNAASLRLVADSMNAKFMSCVNECDEARQLFVKKLASIHPDIEIIIVDPEFKVIAATRKGLLGNIWEEPQFKDILAGKTDYEWNNMEHHGIPVLDVTVPMKGRQDEITGVIHLAKPAVLVKNRIWDARIRHGAFVIFVVLMVVFILGFILYRSVIQRLVQIDREIRQITGPAIIAPDPTGPGDEIDRLQNFLKSLVRKLSGTAISLQHALSEKESLLTQVSDLNAGLETEIEKTKNELQKVQADLIRAEHLSTIGQLAAGLAHEIRNPLFIIRASAESMKKTDGEKDPLAIDIMEEVDRVNAMIIRLLDLARPVHTEKIAVSLADLVSEIADQFTKGLPAEITVTARADGPVPQIVYGDPALLRQAFSNIVENAIHSLSGSGTVDISTGIDTSGTAFIKIHDNGCGIKPEDLPQIFDPFFSRKARGTGLGLASVKKILDIHKAGVAVESCPESGTLFKVCFNGLLEDCDGQDTGSR